MIAAPRKADEPARHAIVAVALLALSVALTAGAVLLTLLIRPHTNLPPDSTTGFVEIAFEIALLGFPVLGALVAWRRPDNRIGWVYLGIGVGWATYILVDAWATYTLYAEPEALPGGAIFGWLGSWLSGTMLFVTMAWPLYLFPDGRLLTPRWRWPFWATTGGIVALALAVAFAPGPLSGYEVVDNPLGFEFVDAPRTVAGVAGLVATIAGVILAAISTVIRLRRARGVEKLQMKWFIWSAAFVGIAMIVALVLSVASDRYFLAGVIAVSALLGIIAASGIAILRYRLIDIDVVINRTLVYGTLTVLLGAVYVGGVILLQQAMSTVASGSDLAVAGTTLAVAALVRPARGRVQRVVDRRFYRGKYDAERTVSVFSDRLRDELDLDALVEEMRIVVHDTMQPEQVWVWLRASDQ